MAHEILVDLFKNRPSLAAEILVEVLGVSLPAYTEARIASADLTEIQPAEYRADAVVVLLDREVSVRVIIVEVQLATDPRKRLSWPAYVTVSRAIHTCPAALLVVAPDPVVAEWCAEPIETGVPGFVLRPPVLRRTAIPVVTDTEEASRRPELGVLSAMAHGESEQGATIAAAVLPAVRGLDDDRARFYYDLVYNSMNDAARRALETMMKGYEYQSDFAKKYVAQGHAEGLTEGLTKGLTEGLSKGLTEGLTKGLTEGLSKGRTEATALNLLTVLRVRGIAVPDDVRERILAQKDPERLERWLEKAAVASSVAAVLDEPN
jgi:flagellar biosynthesis/type III secretory pathway protein FliH